MSRATGLDTPRRHSRSYKSFKEKKDAAGDWPENGWGSIGKTLKLRQIGGQKE